MVQVISGSHMVRFAQERGHDCVVLDDFSTGHEWAVKDCEILRVNLLDHDRSVSYTHLTLPTKA